MAAEIAQKQVNIRIDSTLFEALQSVARQERRSVGQVARILLEESLNDRRRTPPLRNRSLPGHREPGTSHREGIADAR